MTIKREVSTICKQVKSAVQDSGKLSEKVKNAVLRLVATKIANNSAKIIAANKIDIAYALENKIEASKIERLTLGEKNIEGFCKTIEDICNLPDPVDRILYHAKRDNGLEIKRVSTPLGVLFAIFESRPNVAIDIASLALKSGNGVILRSGKESLNSAKILIDLFRESLEELNLDKNLVVLIESTDRDYVKNLLTMDKYIDVVIPRGGKSLITEVIKSTKIPIFRHLDGNCHTYVNQKADFDKARKIILNAKLRRVSICGATESLVIDKNIAEEILPKIVDDLINGGCEVRGDLASKKIDDRIILADAKDFSTEYLDKIVSVKIVLGLTAAINHINKNSSGHTESIVTEDDKAAQKFFDGINSAIVMRNASTQFADGGEFGLGAEVGISTGKLHARGPVGLEQLTTYKYVVTSDCAVRS